MIGSIVRAFDAKLEVSDGERSVVAVISTDAVDRYRTVIEPGGMGFDAYRKNPVVLWNHGCAERTTPIARSAWVKFDKPTRTIVAKSIFDLPDDDFADRIFRLYQAQALRSWSVYCLVRAGVPNAIGSPTSDEIRKRPELADCCYIYRATDLAEYSAVPVPGNAEALSLAVSRGLWMPEQLRRAAHEGTQVPTPEPTATPPPAPELPKLTGCRTLAQATAALVGDLRRQIPAVARATAQDRIDLLRGRV